MREAEKLGVYVSVPFCRAKCSFCNFASGVGSAAAMERYVAQLCAEMEGVGAVAAGLGAELPGAVDTVYLGGGTPSLLAAEALAKIFAALRGRFQVAEDAEVTLEAAPGQIAGELLDAALRLGVNRVSLGVQSFVDRESAAVGRLHTGAECVAEVRRLRRAGMAEVGVDLIAGLPYQTEASWEHSLAAVRGLAAEGALTHASVYLLEIDEDSRLGSEVLAGGTRFHAHGVPQDELAATLYERACAALPEAGLAQYEISNFARAGSEARHNGKYWWREPYVGFGLDAHSMLRRAGEEAVRWANVEELGEYGLPGSRGESRVVGEREAFEETVFLGLRRNEGVALDGLREEWVRGFAESARELVAEGLMTGGEGRWRLTLRGRLVSNEVFGRLLERVAA
jgi:oxygen-independent coproporphyrinogen-3 oxidase